MALTGNTVATTYHSLLKVSTTDNQNFDTTLRDIVDGEDTASCLKLATDKATITLGTDAGDDFVVTGSSASNALVIEGESGQVGIGTALPVGLLTVSSDTATTIDQTECPRIAFYNNQDTELVADDMLGRLTFGAREKSSSGTDRIGAYISAICDATWSTDTENNASKLQFHVEDNSDSAVIDTAKMVIESSGNVGIGTGDPAYKLEVAGTDGSAVQLFHASNFDGSTSNTGAVRIVSDSSNNSDFQMFDGSGSIHIRMHGNASGNDYIGNASGHSLFILGSYDDGLAGTRLPAYIKSDGQVLVDTSSVKYKTNVEDITDVSWLYDLKPRKFEFKEAYQDPVTNRQMRKETGDGIPHYGFIAEEVYELDTVTVVKKGDSVEALQYTEFIPILVKAVQELSAKVTALENA
tara:strand:- start:399 stop:1625 length:1227 start_codon:yes stop_codon:yes gene_type:complete